MTELRIQEICNRCHGSGVDEHEVDAQGNPVPKSCGFCSGEGWLEADKINIDDIMDKFQDVLDKVNDVKTQVDLIWGVVENL